MHKKRTATGRHYNLPDLKIAEINTITQTSMLETCFSILPSGEQSFPIPHLRWGRAWEPFSYVPLLALYWESFSYVPLLALYWESFSYVPLLALYWESFSYVPLLALYWESFSYVPLLALYWESFSYVPLLALYSSRKL